MLGTGNTVVDSPRVDVTKTRRRIEDALRKGASTGDLIKVAETLGVDVAFIPKEECLCSDSTRPCFGPDQVRCRHQLKVGHTYLHKYGGDHAQFVVVREPFCGTKNSDDWWVEVEKTLAGRIKHRSVMSLQDASIYPHSPGNWNKANHFAFTASSRHLACSCQHHCSHHCC